MKKTLVAIAFLAALALSLLAAQAPGTPSFVALRQSAVSVDGGLSRGVGWGDFDGDGRADLVVANTISQLDFIYRNDGAGGFEQLHENAFTLSVGWTEGLSWVDVDNDGALDLFAARSDGSVLFRNTGVGEFEVVDIAEHFAPDVEASQGVWGDIDGDGDLDLFVATGGGAPDRLLENVGGFTFMVVDGPWAEGGGDARSCAFGDADGDGDLDLYVGDFLDDSGVRRRKARNRFYRNDGAGRFSEMRDLEFVRDRALTYGVSWIDFDQDSDLDLFVTNIAVDDSNVLYENRGDLDFVRRDDLAVVAESRGPSKGHTWGDFDNDGNLDLFVANGTMGTAEIEDYGLENFLFMGRGDGGFVRVEVGAIVRDQHTSAGAAWSDFDHDGDLDIFVANWGESDEDNVLYRNDTAGGRWLVIEPRGTASNRQGIGARFEVVARTNGQERRFVRWHLPHTGYGSVNEPIVHFGLGRCEDIVAVEAHWPSGSVERFEGVRVDRRLVVAEGSGAPLRAGSAATGAAPTTRRVPGVLGSYPSFSADGARIVFHAERAGGANQIVTVALDGSDARQLTATAAANLTPVFSPDGTRIVFQSERDGNREIYVMDRDGGNPVNLTNDPHEDSHPKWSADGQWIVFDSDRAGAASRGDLFVMRADGSDVRQLTRGDALDSYPSFSPDGTKVLFRRALPVAGGAKSGMNSEVFLMDRDGSSVRNLTDHPGFDGYPAMSPDGHKVVFASNRDGDAPLDFSLYLLDTASGRVRRLTETIPGVLQARPAFLPGGRAIVFNRTMPDGRVEIHTLEGW